MIFIALAGKTDSKGGEEEKGSTYTRVPEENYTSQGGLGERRVGTRLNFKVKKDFNSIKTRDSVHYCCC